MKGKRDLKAPWRSPMPGHARTPGLPPTKFKPKSRKKLGGGGLSLEAFVTAKSKPAINPAAIREHREFYQNAKKVNKYKKLVKRLNQGDGSSESPVNEVAEKQAEERSDDIGLDISVPKKTQVFKRVPFFKDNQSLQFKALKKFEKQQKGDAPSRLEKLREEFKMKKEEEEQLRKEREELYTSQREAREKAQQQRKDVQSKMRKKTGRGQPVMKHRMQNILEMLQREASC